MTETTEGVLDNVLGWLRRGYPEGVPPKDYFPLLALLKRSLTEEEVVKAAQAVLKNGGLRHRHRGRDPRRGARGDREGAEPGGDTSGRLAVGFRRLAVGGTGSLNAFNFWCRAAAGVSPEPARRSA